MLCGDELVNRSSFLVVPHACIGAVVEHGGFNQFPSKALKLNGMHVLCDILHSAVRRAILPP